MKTEKMEKSICVRVVVVFFFLSLACFSNVSNSYKFKT